MAHHGRDKGLVFRLDSLGFQLFQRVVGFVNVFSIGVFAEISLQHGHGVCPFGLGPVNRVNLALGLWFVLRIGVLAQVIHQRLL